MKQYKIRICDKKRAWRDGLGSKPSNGRMKNLNILEVTGEPPKVFEQGCYYMMVSVP